MSQAATLFETSNAPETGDDTDIASQRLIADLIALDDAGQKLDIEVTDTPVDALLQISEALDDYAALKHQSAEDLKQDIARQMMYFARLVPAEHLYARLFITDTKPQPPDYNPLHIKVYDGTRRHGDDFLQAVRASTIYGTKTSVQTGTDIGALFESGKDKRLILIVGTRKNDDLQTIGAEMGGTLEALAAAGLDPELYEQIMQLLADNPENAELQLLVSLMADYYLNKNEANLPALLQQVIALQAVLEKIDIPLPAALAAQIENIFAEMGGVETISRMAILLGAAETTPSELDIDSIILELEELLPLLEAEGLLPEVQIAQIKETIIALKETTITGITPATLNLLVEVKATLAPLQQRNDIPPLSLAKVDSALRTIEKEMPKVLNAVVAPVALEKNIAPTVALLEIMRAKPALTEIILKPLEAQPALRDKVATAVLKGNTNILAVIATTPALAATLPPAIKEIISAAKQEIAVATAKTESKVESFSTVKPVEEKTTDSKPPEIKVAAPVISTVTPEPIKQSPTQTSAPVEKVVTQQDAPATAVPLAAAAIVASQVAAQPVIQTNLPEVTQPTSQPVKPDTPPITDSGSCGHSNCKCFNEVSGKDVSAPQTVTSAKIDAAYTQRDDGSVEVKSDGVTTISLKKEEVAAISKSHEIEVTRLSAAQRTVQEASNESRIKALVANAGQKTTAQFQHVCNANCNHGTATTITGAKAELGTVESAAEIDTSKIKTRPRKAAPNPN